jgi:uncharacterized integral membrane protein
MKIKKQFSVFFLALLISLSGALSVCADGMIIVKPDPYSDRWDYSDESDQQAYINYQNGLQKMIVGVKMNAAADKDAIWLFPVPADPAKVVIDIATELPQMRGEEVSGRAKMSFSNAKDFLYGSQIYPLFFRQRSHYGSYEMDSEIKSSLSLPVSDNSASQDVVVHESLDKEGMTTEIITAKTANGLYDYFKLKGLKIEAGMIPVLDGYIGKDFSFVASWINKSEMVKSGGDSIWANYPESSLRQLLLAPELQDMLVSMTAKYPLIGARRAGDGAVAMNLEAAVGYLQSSAGKPALKEFLSLAGNMGLIEETADDDTYGSEMINSSGRMMAPPSLAPNPDYPVTPARQRVKGVLVMFPTDKIYFPLLPTSVYESKIVPATIKVAGYVTPELFEDIKNFSTVNYYTNARFYGGQGNNDFFGTNKETGYTKIEINPPSKYLTSDLWIKNAAPAKTIYASLVANHPLAVSISLLIICSLLAGLLAGLALLKDMRTNIGKIFLLGASNCLSIIGLIAATFYVLPKKSEQEEAALMEKLKQKGYLWKRKTAQILFLAAVIMIAYNVFVASSNYYYAGSFPFTGSYFPLIIVFFGWLASRVRYEDAPLFAELEAKGYSTWTMRKKGRSRKLYIVFFSLLFLAISWLAVKLLTMTV